MVEMTLQQIVDSFALGLQSADARRPVFKKYSPGIGSHPETAVVSMVMDEAVK